MLKKIIRIIPSVVLLMMAISILGTKSYAAEVKQTTILGSVNYSAVYDYDYYVTNNPDVKQAFGDNGAAVLNHFVTCGMAEGRQASANFNVSSYKNAYPDLRAAFGSHLKSYYMHYIFSGKSEGRIATGITELVGGVTKVGSIDYSAVYNYQYYISKNPDIQKAFGNNDIAVLNHFVSCGMAEGRQASANFDVYSYKNANPDLRVAFGSNLKSYYMHYVASGKSEGRTATGVTKLIATTNAGGIDYSAVYDYQYYLSKNPDIQTVFGNNDIAALNHFITNGMSEGRQASGSFDIFSYKNEYPDLRAAFGKNLKSYYMHYIFSGKSEGRTATGVTKLVGTTRAGGIDYSAVYDYQDYISKNPDIQKVFGNDDVATLNHFIANGMSEGRQASEKFNVSIYKGNYIDLQEAFGSTLKPYYLHYIGSAKSEGRTGTQQIHNYIRTVAVGGLKIYTCSICGDTYKMGGLKQGIDVSVHQGAIDWQKVKNSGIDFAIIRVGYGDDYDKVMGDQDDSTAIYNMSECEKLGIPYGVYLYSYALTEDQAKSEATHLLRMLNGRNPSIGVYLDVEDTAYYQKHNFDPYDSNNKALLNNFCNIVLNTLKSHGYSAGIYSNSNYYKNVLDISKLSSNNLWLAHWDIQVCPSGNWHVWQYTSKGMVPGISGNVDMNVLID